MLPTATATATAAQLSPCGGGSICIFAAWQQRRATPMPKGFREGFANGAGRGGPSTWTETGTGTGVGLSALATHKL